MRVYEIMTRDVITVRPETPIQEAAELMVTCGVSGLPVVDDHGAVVGILSEGDLIVRQKPRERLPWWRSFFDDGERLAREYRKAMGTTAAEVMTRSVICVSPDLPIEAAAVILDERRIRRLPVVRDGRLVGIVSRGDLVKTLAATPSAPPASRSDAELLDAMKERMAREPWASKLGIVPQVEHGVLALWGLVETESEKAALETMARTVPGARGVESHLVVKSAVPYVYWI
ncbi:MAG: CBS domain-containing protein [Candidatus Rokubacteria bacterium]|nr:CBS domain-containing protein [Candidatus Rokubacteria bacterium]